MRTRRSLPCDWSAPAALIGLGILLCLSLAPSAQAAPLALSAPESVSQGQPFFLTVAAEGPCESLRVHWMGKVLTADLAGANGGRILLGAGLGMEPGPREIRVEAVVAGRSVMARVHVNIMLKNFPEQRLTLPKGMVAPSRENLERIKQEQAVILEALATVTPKAQWTLPFLRPVPGEVTSAFGLRRVLNGQPRAQHKGLDLDGRTGEDVLAANPGRVILTGDFYYNGNSVFLDHGQGVVSMYFHLSRVDVTQGQDVRQGQVVGQVGATGRVTGPHLHFGLSVLGQAVDPEPLFAEGGS